MPGIPDVEGVHPLDILHCDDTGEYRAVLEQARGAGTGDHHRFQIHVVLFHNYI